MQRLRHEGTSRRARGRAAARWRDAGASPNPPARAPFTHPPTHPPFVGQELAEFRQESTELKNQGVTIRRLEERARELEAALAEKAGGGRAGARRRWAAAGGRACRRACCGPLRRPMLRSPCAIVRVHACLDGAPPRGLSRPPVPPRRRPAGPPAGGAAAERRGGAAGAAGQVGRPAVARGRARHWPAALDRTAPLQPAALPGSRGVLHPCPAAGSRAERPPPPPQRLTRRPCRPSPRARRSEMQEREARLSEELAQAQVGGGRWPLPLHLFCTWVLMPRGHLPVCMARATHLALPRFPPARLIGVA